MGSFARHCLILSIKDVVLDYLQEVRAAQFNLPANERGEECVFGLSPQETFLIVAKGMIIWMIVVLSLWTAGIVGSA